MCLEYGVPPEKPFNHFLTSCYDSSITTKNHIVNSSAFTNTTTPSHLVTFNSCSVQLCIDACVTGGLLGFVSDLIPGTCNSTTATKTNTDAGEATMVGQITATCTFIDDKGDSCTITTLMSYYSQRKCRLMSP